MGGRSIIIIHSSGSIGPNPGILGRQMSVKVFGFLSQVQNSDIDDEFFRYLGSNS